MTNRPKAKLRAQRDLLVPDNTSQLVSAADLRSVTGDYVDSCFRENAYLLEGGSGRLLMEDENGYYILDETDPPPFVADLLVWLDPADSSTMWQDSSKTTAVTTAGDPIGYWEDKSGNGNDFTQTDSARRPTWQGTYVQFQTDWVVGPDLSSHTNGTLMASVQVPDQAAAGTTDGGGMFHFSSMNSTGSAAHWALGSSSGANYHCFCSTVRALIFSWTTDTSMNSETEVTYGITHDGTDALCYVDATLESTDTMAVGNLGTAPLVGGTRRSSNIADWAVADGRITRKGLLLYDRALNGTEISTVHSFLTG